MRYYLADKAVLKWLETPAVYDIRGDELYELDEKAFLFLKGCSESDGCSDGSADKGFIDYCLSEGILTAAPVNIKRPAPVKSPVPSLRYLELQITDRCNLRCRHCYIGQAGNSELSTVRVKTIMDEFESMQGLRLLITGGEPLIHSSFDEINSILPEYSFRKILFSNGLLLDNKLLRRLNVDEIQFSVDGMERGHDALRGKGTYRRVMRRIEDAITSGMAVSIATMVHRENLDEFEMMDALFKRIGVEDWTVDVPCVTGNLKDNPVFQVRPDVAGRYLNYGFGGGLHGGGEGYACGLHLLSILADGKASKCAFYADEPAGYISEGLRICWSKIRPVRLEELECSKLSCRFIDACRGGCRYRAEITPGIKINAHKRDIYKCYSYGIMESSGHEARDKP